MIPILNGLNSPNTKQNNWMDAKKKKRTNSVVQTINSSYLRTCIDWSEGIEQDIPHKWIQKKLGAILLISDEVDFNSRAVRRDKED
jgi:hypothetical protein